MMCNDIIQKTISLEPARYRFNGLDASLYKRRDGIYKFDSEDIARFVVKPNEDDGEYYIKYEEALYLYTILMDFIHKAKYLQPDCDIWVKIHYSSNIERFLYVVDSLGIATEISNGYLVSQQSDDAKVVMGLSRGDYILFNELFRCRVSEGVICESKPLEIAREFYYFADWWLNNYDMSGPYLNDLDVNGEDIPDYPFITVLSSYTMNEKEIGKIDTQLRKIIRYRTLVDHYVWLKNFIRDSKVMVCTCESCGSLVITDYEMKRTSGNPCYSWIAEYDPKMLLFLDNTKHIKFINSIDSISTVSNTIYFVTDGNIDELTHKFLSIDDARTFYCMASKYLYPKNSGDTTIVCSGTNVQYIDVPFLLTEECDEFGNYRVDEFEYSPYKKYRIFDRVVLDGKIYQLKAGKELDRNIISYSAYNAIKATMKDNGGYFKEYKMDTENGGTGPYVNSYVDNSNGVYYNYIPCVFGADFGPNGKENQNGEYWDELSETNGKSQYTGYTSVSYAKYMVNPTPKVFGTTEYSGKTWHNHSVGSDGHMYADYLKEVTYEEKELIVTFHYYKGIDLGPMSSIDSISDRNGNVIGRFIIDYVNKKSKCVEYIEKYEYSETIDEIKEIDFSHSALQFPENLLNENIFAIFTAYTEYTQYNEIDISKTPYLFDPSLIGIVDLSESIDGGIERGIGAAFERHLILGEVNTMADLENYRNNYFGV